MEELLIFADVLDVAPVHLLVPIEDVEYQVTPNHVEGARRVRMWVRGEHGLDHTDLRTFASEVPQHEFGRGEWPETVTYERIQENGRPERWTIDLGGLQDIRLSRKPEWRRVEQAGSDGGAG